MTGVDTSQPRTVLVTGAGGQDGQILTRELLARGWSVTGVVNKPAAGDPAYRQLSADLSDPAACAEVVHAVQPEVIVHLAAISSVGWSWQDPVGTGLVNGMSTAGLLTAARDLVREGHPVHVVNATSGEIFAGATITPQNETTPLSPTSPYGAAKGYSHILGAVFRSEGVTVSNAILYPHESPLRDPRFVTRKITQAAAEIANGTRTQLALGNLTARRDWGWAADYVDAMIRMAEHRANDDFVVATGQSHSVEDFTREAFAAAGIERWERHVVTDTTLFRPADSVDLVGDSTRLRSRLGWHPTKTFHDVVAAMVSHDMDLISQSDGLPAITG
ncbi:GDP-mannose 4,6-dehydratase [Gordonia sp. NPDC003504]